MLILHHQLDLFGLGKIDALEKESSLSIVHFKEHESYIELIDNRHMD